MNSAGLISQIAPPLDLELTSLLIAEFIAMERRFVLQDWEPATLDGGQFCEILSRIVYHFDSGNCNRRKPFGECLRYIENEAMGISHNFPNRRTALHLCKVLRTVYKFRSQRGAIHIDPDYSANEIDSSMLLANVRWLMAEILRVFWTGDTSTVSKAIQEIVRFNVPAILNFDGKRLVLRTDCTIEEEVLLLLHDAGQNGMTRNEIGLAIPKSASSVSTAIVRLKAAKKREILLQSNDRFILTLNGIKRVKENLGPKLSLT